MLRVSLEAEHSLNQGTQRLSDRFLPGSRVALAIGFGGLLVIVAVAGVDGLRALRQIRSADNQIRSEFLFRNHVLNDVRSELYLSGTYVRDYLLEPEPARAETFRASLEQVRQQMESALNSYHSRLRPDEQPAYSNLTGELSQYWRMLGPILKWSAAERRSRGYEFLRDEVFPRRQAVLEIAGQIAAINEQQLRTGNERVVGLLLSFQTRLLLTLIVTLALGLAMAAFTTRKILSLEADAHAQYRAVAQARGQLKDLSARLVQAQESERRSLSRELHDEVGQSLSAVLVELGNLSAGLTNRSHEESRAQVDLIRGLVETTVRTVRNMALLLRPSMLDDLGLVPALRWQAREVSKRTGMDVTVAAETVSDDLPDDYKTCVYRVVQEALHNCSRHSKAAKVRIRVHESPLRLSLSIQDDGCGFDPAQTKGLGLLGIEERVVRLGGTCAVKSAAGSGTVLSAELPLRAPQPEHGSPIPSETDSHPVGR